MTDLISRLADDILALINAQPRSPTKEELEGVLQPLSGALRMLKDAEALASPFRTVVWDFAKNPVLLSVNDCQGEPMIIEAVPGRPMAGYVTLTTTPLTTKAEPSFAHSDCQGEWAITQEDLVKAADEVCEREAVRKSDLYASYEAKAQLPCPHKQWAAPAGEHHWRPTGFDQRGLFCQVGDERDVSGGTHLHCTCGASKFT